MLYIQVLWVWGGVLVILIYIYTYKYNNIYELYYQIIQLDY